MYNENPRYFQKPSSLLYCSSILCSQCLRLFSCGRVKEGLENAMQSPEKDVEKAEEALDRAQEKVQECVEGEEMVDGECVAVADEAMTNAKKATDVAKKAISDMQSMLKM